MTQMLKSPNGVEAVEIEQYERKTRFLDRGFGIWQPSIQISGEKFLGCKVHEANDVAVFGNDD